MFVGDDIVLVVLGIENNRVRLGLEAPTDVAILREEIVDDKTIERIDANIRAKQSVRNDSSLNTGTG